MLVRKVSFLLLLQLVAALKVPSSKPQRWQRDPAAFKATGTEQWRSANTPPPVGTKVVEARSVDVSHAVESVSQFFDARQAAQNAAVGAETARRAALSEDERAAEDQAIIDAEADRAEFFRVAALEERMAMAAQHEAEMQAAQEAQMRREAASVVARVEMEQAEARTVHAAKLAVPILKKAIQRIKTNPVATDLEALAAEMAPYTSALAAVHDTSLVERFHDAMAAAERAKMEANAKKISDAIESMVSVFVPSEKVILPAEGTVIEPLEAVFVPYEPEDAVPFVGWTPWCRYPHAW